MTVTVWMQGHTSSVRVLLNDTTRRILRMMPKTKGSYLVRCADASRALTPYIVK